MIPLTNKENKSLRGKKKSVTTAKNNLVLMITMKSIKMTEIIVIAQENLEELFLVFVMYIQNTKRNSYSIS